ncbi:MAG: host attachment protein [Acidiferrobacterales bacterium]
MHEQERADGELRLLQDIPHPAGRLKNREITSDKSGRLFDSIHTRHTVSNASEPKIQAAEDFAWHIADQLQYGRTANRYRQLVLVAEPAFPGGSCAPLWIHIRPDW